jgi:sulfur-oxidizing protein SoxA
VRNPAAAVAAIALAVAAITGEIAPAVSALAGEIAPTDRRSGYDFMSRETRAMQDDDTANPGMLWVLEGAALWGRKAGAAGRACADCHGEARESMKGVAARHPAFDATRGRPVNLEQRINRCRIDRQQAPPLGYESRDLLALTAYVARQSRGLLVDVAIDQRTRPFLDAGRATFHRRQGQLNLACSQCHDDSWGRQLAGNVIPQAHPTGYPLYRLEWQGLGSLQRRLRNCLVGIRAEPYDYGAPELVDLELFLMWRARGMPLEAPAVRP